MIKSVTNLRLLAGFGVAAALFLGCQDFLGEKGGGTPAAGTEDEDVALRLSIRNDSSCLEQFRIIRTGNPATDLDSAQLETFLTDCMVEKKRGPGKAVPVIPPDLLPDSALRCEWIVGNVRKGRVDLLPARKKHCPDHCRKSDVADTVGTYIFCQHEHPKPREPKDSLHVHVPKDSSHVHGPKDSLHVHVPKDSLRVHVPKDSSHVHGHKDSLHVHVPKDSVKAPTPVDAQP